MFSLRKPCESAVRAFLQTQSRLELSYPAVGATAAVPPTGYVVDHTQVRLGTGQAAFASARAALQRWAHFRLGWVDVCWPATPIETGQVVAVLARACGLWTLNACRIVYVVDETTTFGFAYGTLPGHVESGEERFRVDWRREDDSVWYDIVAFSRPNYFLARLGFQLVRRLQKRFGRDSAAAMVKAVGGD